MKSDYILVWATRHPLSSLGLFSLENEVISERDMVGLTTAKIGQNAERLKTLVVQKMGADQ
jgi:hypothetical protein